MNKFKYLRYLFRCNNTAEALIRELVRKVELGVQGKNGHDCERILKMFYSLICNVGRKYRDGSRMKIKRVHKKNLEWLLRFDRELHTQVCYEEPGKRVV